MTHFESITWMWGPEIAIVRVWPMCRPVWGRLDILSPSLTYDIIELYTEDDVVGVPEVGGVWKTFKIGKSQIFPKGAYVISTLPRKGVSRGHGFALTLIQSCLIPLWQCHVGRKYGSKISFGTSFGPIIYRFLHSKSMHRLQESRNDPIQLDTHSQHAFGGFTSTISVTSTSFIYCEPT